MPAEMPRGYTRVYNRAIWRPASRAWWGRRGSILVVEVIVTLVLAGIFWLTGYDAVGWSIVISIIVIVGVAIGWLLCFGVSESARRDWRQSRTIEEARGDLTDEEVSQAQRDRKTLQRLAFQLIKLLYSPDGVSVIAPTAEQRKMVQDALARLEEVAIQTDNARGELYYDAVVRIEEEWRALRRGQTDDPKDTLDAIVVLRDLEIEDRDWVLRRRRFKPSPED